MRMESGSDPSLCEDVLRQPLHVIVGGTNGAIHKTSHKEREGSKATPLMPLLFAFGLHSLHINAGESVAEREGFLFSLMMCTSFARHTGCSRSTEYWRNCRTMHRSLHHGKAQVWNRVGVPLGETDIFTRAARRVNPDAIVWRGDTSLPRGQQGVKILGVPVGQCAQFLGTKNGRTFCSVPTHSTVEDPQATWLLLVCASTRANYCLRCVRPDFIEAFEHRHDASVWECFRQIFRITPDHDVARVTASLLVSVGGLGLPAASRSREGAHWASWADCLP